MNKTISVPKKMEEKYNEIATIIEEFCSVHLNKEYEQLCLQLCAALCRKRPSPLEKGRANTWACGIVHAIGTANFLFDSSQHPTITPKELYEGFGVSGGTGSSKSKQIRDLMKIDYFNTDWALPSKLADNPMVWMISVNGFAIDARNAPKEIQEHAYKMGIIPYIPE
ncbi:DUF6398 domain-containing protein [Anaerobacillus isosaccharinicus]|uniref:DUF6398 domain-containing protein n=1 Tax=Anaerobacillus isosaccharinicus TaxID=1532552 RepID=A0A1S2M4P6_9BACI|nr:DUF6398 domain-containing protein [Anaerobacillus isosaccharinicus]MBA5586408.1 hypothetical protein [Anaerobacillus isosaccharinicus]QOY35347.1 hypothetical protein AWH56_022070 [Anaerobacillus isosaccharinicus]